MLSVFTKMSLSNWIKKKKKKTCQCGIHSTANYILSKDKQVLQVAETILGDTALLMQTALHQKPWSQFGAPVPLRLPTCCMAHSTIILQEHQKEEL